MSAFGFVAPYRAAPAGGPVRIWTPGDSIMAGAIPVSDGAGGWTYSYRGGWRRYVYSALLALGLTPLMLGALLNASHGLAESVAGLRHNGNNNSSAAQWLASFFQSYFEALFLTPADHPHLILIALGANDADSVGTGENIGALVDLAAQLAPRANILVGNVLPRTSMPGTTVNAQIATEIAARRRRGLHCELVDQAAAVPLSYAPDGTHLSAAGYGRAGDVWTAAVLRLVR